MKWQQTLKTHFPLNSNQLHSAQALPRCLFYSNCFLFSPLSTLLPKVPMCLSPQPRSLSVSLPNPSPLVILSFPTDMGIIGSQGCPYSIIKV